MFGIALIDKPQGITSHDVVNQLRRKFSTKRVGHAGTLDPLATGALVVAVGPATRFLQYLPLEPKVYDCEITFGIETNTQDGEGEIVAEKPAPDDLEARLYDAIPKFVGLVEQLPPMFSAVKKDGKPLYAYARKGEDVERSARTVHIELIDVTELVSPVLKAKVTCSGGTYMRTLAHDLGQEIGCGAFLSRLRRTAVGRFDVKDCVALDHIEATDLISLAEALPPMPLIELNPTQIEAIRHGQKIGYRSPFGSNLLGLLDASGSVFGVARVEGPMLQPECVIPIEVAHGVA